MKKKVLITLCTILCLGVFGSFYNVYGEKKPCILTKSDLKGMYLQSKYKASPGDGTQVLIETWSNISLDKKNKYIKKYGLSFRKHIPFKLTYLRIRRDYCKNKKQAELTLNYMLKEKGGDSHWKESLYGGKSVGDKCYSLVRKMKPDNGGIRKVLFIKGNIVSEIIYQYPEGEKKATDEFVDRISEILESRL